MGQRLGANYQTVQRCVERAVADGALAALDDRPRPAKEPGIEAIATTAPDLPPVPDLYPAFARDFEYRRHGTLSLLTGIDLLTGKVQALAKTATAAASSSNSSSFSMPPIRPAPRSS